ncbi:MAG: SAM-dependent methyltransferase, partial [Sciscionella sp.]
YEQVLPLFDGYALLDPGLVFTSRWRPDPGDDLSDAETCASYTGVGRKLP